MCDKSKARGLASVDPTVVLICPNPVLSDGGSSEKRPARWPHLGHLCDAIILATGYRPTVDFVAHELRLAAEGTPLVDREWRAIGNPSLYCVGFWYPTTEGWLTAIGRVARTAAQSIAHQLR